MAHHHHLPYGKRKLFVRGFADDVNQDDIKKIFSTFGKITEVIIPRHHETQQSRGYAFVTFESLADSKNACKAIHGKKFQGKALFVETALPKGFRRSFHDLDDDRRSDEISYGRERRHSSSLHSHLPRAFYHKERSSGAHYKPYECDSRSYYGEEELPTNDRRYGTHSERRLHYKMQLEMQQETELYSNRNGGRHDHYHRYEYSRPPSSHGQQNHFLPEHFIFPLRNDYSDYDMRMLPDNRLYNDGLRRRYDNRSPASSNQSQHVEQHSDKFQRPISPDSRYAHGSHRYKESRRMEAVRRRPLSQSGHHSKQK